MGDRWSTALRPREESSAELSLVSPPVEQFSAHSWTDRKKQIDRLELCSTFSNRAIPACRWYQDDKNNNASKRAKHFHEDFQKLNQAGCWAKQTVADRIYSIEKGYLDDILSMEDPQLTSDAPQQQMNTRNEIRKLFEQARLENNPYLVVKAYTYNQNFVTQLNMILAKSTYHELELYCTPLNCIVLSRIQESTRALVSIMFHKIFDDYVFSEGNLYRGVILRGEEKKLVMSYEKDQVTITTTFLSTSTDENVANCFSDGNPLENDALSVSCRYKLTNTKRRTALDISTLSFYPSESEILILPYVPFRIIELTKSIDGKKMDIYFEELEDA